MNVLRCPHQIIHALAVTALFATASAEAQPLSDTTFTWRGYSSQSTCRARVYPSSEKERPRVVVIDEIAENRGPSTLDDAHHLVELLARHLDVQPDSAFWVFHWGRFSFDSSAGSPAKEFFLRATFRATASGAVSSPSWRLLTKTEIEQLTERRYR